LFTLFRVVIVSEHLVEHEVEKVCVRHQQLNQFLTFNLRETFDLFRSASLDYSEISLEQIWLVEPIALGWAVDADPRHGDILVAGFV